MFNELERVIESAIHYDDYISAIDENVIGKRSASALKKAKQYLVSLYGFDSNDKGFGLFIHLWGECEDYERRLLTLLLALRKDQLLEASIPFITSLEPGENVDRTSLRLKIDDLTHYSENTLKKTVVRILSSWKQTGYLQGRVKAHRIAPRISAKVAAYAIALGRFEGLTGQYLVNTPYIKALGLTSHDLDVLFNEATVNDYIKYQNAGNVMVFTLGERLVHYE